MAATKIKISKIYKQNIFTSAQMLTNLTAAIYFLKYCLKIKATLILRLKIEPT